MKRLGLMLAAAAVISMADGTAHAKMAVQTFPVLAGAGVHDVYPAPDGTVWITAQSAGKLGQLNPRTGKSDLIALGPGAAPHGVIVGPDGAAWVTEGGQNAIARVDPATRGVKLFPLPKERRNANLNTAASIARACSGSPGKKASTAGLIPNRARWQCLMRRAAPGPMASPLPRMARCSLPRSPATISARSISRPAASRSWSHLSRAKAAVVSRATATAPSGSPAGAAETSSDTTARARVGRTGTCRATGRSPPPSMSTRPMRCG